MRILVVTNLGPVPWNPWGGVFMPPRMKGLVAAGCHPTLVMPVFRGRVVEFAMRAQAGDFRLRPPPARPVQHDPQWHFVSVPVYPWDLPSGVFGDPDRSTARIAAKIIESHGEQFDVVQAHGMYAFWAGGVARHLSSRLGVPFTITMHGSDLMGLKSWRHQAFRRVSSTAAGMFFVSGALASVALERGLVTVPHAIAPNGFDGDLFNTAGREPGDRLRVLFVGNLIKVKGADRIPSIMEHVWRSEPNAALEVIGDGPMRQELASQLGGTETRFHGRVPPAMVAQRMRAADVLLLPSRSEGWPCVVLEAQACGTRVVATDVGGTRDAVGSGGEVVGSTDLSPMDAAEAVMRQWRRSDALEVAARAQAFEWSELGQQEAGRLREWVRA